MKDEGGWTRLDLLARRLTPFLITITLVIVAQVPMHLPAAISIAPALALIAVYFWALHQPDLIPAPVVFLTGLLQDILTGVPFGLNAFILLIVYGIVVSQRRFFFGKSFAVLWWGFATLSLVIGALQWVAMSILMGQLLSIGPLLVEYLATAALYPLVAYILVLTHRNILQEA